MVVEFFEVIWQPAGSSRCIFEGGVGMPHLIQDPVLGVASVVQSL
jgi:hypothetical protein